MMVEAEADDERSGALMVTEIWKCLQPGRQLRKVISCFAFG